eukprot:gene25779-11447_t
MPSYEQSPRYSGVRQSYETNESEYDPDEGNRELPATTHSVSFQDAWVLGRAL